ncbi:MAG: hypothetical protein EKK33_21265 [Bradyrhizobiaceae bacterium]|nr:MAG: hypothetical protein EKK33_21265 [Bradyrhizobiaceae bacterium]
MAAFLNNCRFISTAGGTTDWVYSSAVGGCQSPALAGAVDGRKYKFIAISSDLTQWEIAEGAYAAASGTFARTTVLCNSSGSGVAAGQSGAGSRINFIAVPNVAVVGIKEDLISIEEANAFTDAQKAQARQNIDVRAYGQCRLVKSGANLVLLPLNGNLLTINGLGCAIPAGGVSLAPTGLTSGVTYYIYATASGVAVNGLEASTIGHATSATSGNVGTEIKSGDDTRSLVGIARAISGPAWQDTAAQRFVRTWFNRTRLSVTGATDTASTETNNSTYIEKLVSKAEFVCFADDAILAGAYGMMTNTSNGWTGLQVFVDGALAGIGLDWNIVTSGGRASYNPVWPTNVSSDGYHYVSFGMRTVGGGTVSVATYQGMAAIAVVG